MRRLIGLPLLLASLAVSPAFGKDKKEEDDDTLGEPGEGAIDAGEFKEDSEEDDEPPPTRNEEDDSEEEDKDSDDINFDDPSDEPEIEFNDDAEQETVKARGPGEDTAQIYRDTQKNVADVNPDEEQLTWEEYLQKYPNSLFRDRIEARMEELSNLMFGERVEGSDQGAVAERDAALREINFGQPLRFGGVDPRSKVTAGFEIGIPNWFGAHADLEYQILRQFSVHGGLQRGLSGWEIVAGAKYALLKSARTNTLLTGMLDLNVNSSPAFVALQPGIGFGQRLDVAEGLDLQLIVATDLEFRNPFNPRYFLGFASELHANEVLHIFLETGLDTKYLGSQDVPTFRFYTANFGIKFVPVKGKGVDKNGRVLVDVGASAPFGHSYWGFYEGAIDAAMEFYL